MTKDEKIKYIKKMFAPRWVDRMLVAYSEYFEWNWKKETIEENENKFRKCWEKKWYSAQEIEQGIQYMKELSKN